jgi:hypothetical protein
VKLLLDEVYPPIVAEQLRTRGHDVLSVAEGTLRTGEDAVVFAVAQHEQRVVVTEDTGFRRMADVLVASGRVHGGLVFTSNRALPRANPRTPGRLVTALDGLLTSGVDLTNREHWLG